MQPEISRLKEELVKVIKAAQEEAEEAYGKVIKQLRASETAIRKSITDTVGNIQINFFEDLSVEIIGNINIQGINSQNNPFAKTVIRKFMVM